MSVYPTQERVVDPFSSYHSNVVNRFTRLISRGVDCLHSTHAMDVSIDSTSPLDTVVVSTGQCFKDDVLISITADHEVDFSNLTNYISAGAGFDEAGTYYIVLEYTFTKSKPAPQASIKIIKPSQRTTYIIDPKYLFLKAVIVIWNADHFEISSLDDKEPAAPNPTYSRRKFSQLFIGIEFTLPSFSQDDDEGRMIYVLDEDEVYYGASGHWEPMNAVRASKDTTSVGTAGKLGYLKADGTVDAAISTSPMYFADCVVTQIGADDGDGMVRLYGPVTNVQVQSGITITAGQSVYLSATESGQVTNLIPDPYHQYVGVCTGAGSVANTINLWFMPNAREEGGASSPNWFDQYLNLLLNSVYTRMTVDTFVNTDRIDPTTTAELNLSYKRIDGVAAEFLLTTDLVEDDYDLDGTSGVIVSCQLSADDDGDIDYYVSNYGGADGWEGPIDLNVVHDFAQVTIPLASASGFEINEVVTESISGKTAIVNGISGVNLLLRNVIMSTLFTVGRTLTGSESLASSVIQAPGQENRTSDDYIDIRIKAIFNGTGYINDYALLYDEDETILDTTPENEYNIETLYHDVYTSPSIDDDGLANLGVPLQTRIEGYLHTEDGTANTVWEVVHSLDISDRIACVVCTDLSYNLITPTSIVFDSVDSLTITFASGKTGYAKVRG